MKRIHTTDKVLLGIMIGELRLPTPIMMGWRECRPELPPAIRRADPSYRDASGGLPPTLPVEQHHGDEAKQAHQRCRENRLVPVREEITIAA